MEDPKSEGWHLTDEVYQKCLKQSTNKFSITDVLLSTDIKEVAVASLPCDFAKSKPAKLVGPLVVQIQKVKNISALTTRQESSTAARMFKFSLYDGCQAVPAIEMESLHNIGFGTAPGSKLLLKGTIHVNQGILLLTNSNCKLLGGKVETMYEKWQLNRELMKLTRKANRPDGPPQFLQLGQKVKKDKIDTLTGKFNSLEVASATPAAVERDNAEFDAQRQAVINEALQQQEKTTYGGLKQVNAHVPLERTEFKRPERKIKKPSLDDKDPNVSDDEEQGRGRGSLVCSQVCVQRSLEDRVCLLC
ncbi:tudor domain-containing protein 3-like [Watersipora subatra]|uniref:tudor domain-containing protein 3-like n=1 Tax=Watersipora subatra TaxID=2589382 RepID=UPI00355B8596